MVRARKSLRVKLLRSLRAERSFLDLPKDLLGLDIVPLMGRRYEHLTNIEMVHKATASGCIDKHQ